MIIPPVKKSKIDNTIEITMKYLRESTNLTPEQRRLFTDFIDTLNRYKSQEYPEQFLEINKESLNPLNKEQINDDINPEDSANTFKTVTDKIYKMILSKDIKFKDNIIEIPLNTLIKIFI
jgi:hypothetical protein